MQHPHVRVGKVEIAQEPEIAGAFGIVSVPAMALLHDGAVVRTMPGAKSRRQIEAVLPGSKWLGLTEAKQTSRVIDLGRQEQKRETG
jgi:thioredoxin-like negative regulator of GroEL